MTLRRDLTSLEADGLVRRVRGGATKPYGPKRFSARLSQNRSAKAIIAEKAKKLIPTTGSLAFDGSTTTYAIAETLENADDLTIVTNSWETFSALKRTGARAILTGGETDEIAGSLVGLLACRAAASVSYQIFFSSCAAIDLEYGSCDVSFPEAQVKQEFARSAQRTILLADSSKLGQQDVVRGFNWQDFELLITELSPGHELLEPLRDRVELL